LDWTSADPWAYWNGSTSVKPTVLPPNNGSLSLVVPAGVSKLQFVYYREDSFTVAGRSPEITVAEAGMGCWSQDANGNRQGTWSAGPCTVPSGNRVDLKWDFLDVTSCVASSQPAGLWSGTKNASGLAMSDGAVTSNGTIFSLACTGPGGITKNGSVTINLLPVAGNHFSCVNNACVSVSGVGANECAIDEDCRGTNGGTHAVCVLGTGGAPECILVSGAGTDQCTPGVGGCGEVHSECVASACAIVSGAGTNKCSLDSICNGSECVGAGCSSPGGGGNGFCSFGVSPNRIVTPPSRATMLSWGCQDVQNCTLSEGIGAVGLTGTRNHTPSHTTTYRLTCKVTATGNSVVSEATIRVFRLEGGDLREILP
jgi:hypothetical protein